MADLTLDQARALMRRRRRAQRVAHDRAPVPVQVLVVRLREASAVLRVLSGHGQHCAAEQVVPLRHVRERELLIEGQAISVGMPRWLLVRLGWLPDERTLEIP